MLLPMPPVLLQMPLEEDHRLWKYGTRRVRYGLHLTGVLDFNFRMHGWEAWRETSGMKERYQKSQESAKYSSRLRHRVYKISKHEAFILQNWRRLLLIPNFVSKSDVIRIIKIIGYWRASVRVACNELDVCRWWSLVQRSVGFKYSCVTWSPGDLV